MKKIIFFLFFINFFVVFSQANQAPKDFTVSGFVEDSASGETLIGVNVYSSDFKFGTTTNSFGFFSLTIPEGQKDLNFSNYLLPV